MSTKHYYALSKGVRLHEFEIEEVLGHGGFGITYLATDTLLQERVAIKEYLPNEIAVRSSDATVQPKSEGDAADFAEGRAAFLEEARLLARFHHPNILQVRRFFELHGTGYIVSRYELGETLRDRLERGPIAEPELRAIVSGVLDGLEAVHERAILHRDLKPGNIILRADGTPVLIDFGAARDFKIRQTRSVTAIATRGFSPPEQYGVGGQHGPWTDLYALGAIAYRCVSGEAPIDSLARLRKDPLVPAVIAGKDRFDPGLLQTVDWMLKVDEAQRPQSVKQVRAALSSSSSPLPVMAPKTAVPVVLGVAGIAAGGGAAPSRPGQSFTRWALPAAAALLMVAGTISYFAWQADMERERVALADLETCLQRSPCQPASCANGLGARSAISVLRRSRRRRSRQTAPATHKPQPASQPNNPSIRSATSAPVSKTI